MSKDDTTSLLLVAAFAGLAYVLFGIGKTAAAPAPAPASPNADMGGQNFGMEAGGGWDS